MKPSPARSLDEAIAALQASRQQLRTHMLPPAEPAHDDSKPGSWPRSWRLLWRRGRFALRRWPAAMLAQEALSEAWHRHPWRPAAQLLSQEVRGIALPGLKRHPIASVVAAAALGAAIALARPWRWPSVAAHLRPLPRRTGAWVLRLLTASPFQALLLDALTWARRQPTEPPAPNPAQGPSEDASQGGGSQGPVLTPNRP
jgi:hypothetical protein